MAKWTKEEREIAVRDLRKVLRPGATVHCILRHVSSSGMSRRIDLYTVKKNALVYLSGLAAIALDERVHKDGSIVVGGCGMDMGFHLVYSLGRVLFPKGFVPAKANMHGRNGTPNTELDQDGGYALHHRWM